jgi:hypothetical protein
MTFVGRALPALRAAGVMMGVSVVAAAGVGYWFFISQQRDYILGRDFRLLTNLTRQVNNAAQAEARVIQNLPNEPSENLAATWSTFRGKPYQSGDITFKEGKLPGGGTEYMFRVDGHLLLDVAVPARRADGEVLLATLKFQRGLESLFSSRVGPAGFDGIVLGTRDGKVLVSSGPVAQQLSFSGLDVLSSKATDAHKSLKFAELSEAITMAEVSVAGVDYTLFVTPCCLPAHPDDNRLVLAGLVRSEKLQAGSWAIPTTLVKMSVLALLLALVAWPFLKLILQGERERMGVADFFQLGGSSVAGLAILTVVLLDVSAYRQLNRDMDAQLNDLAHTLDTNATTEIADAYAQLKCLEQKVDRLNISEDDDRRFNSVLSDARLGCAPPMTAAIAARSPVIRERLWKTEQSISETEPSIEWRYPFFDTVAMIDSEGMQYLKLATSAKATNLVNVGDREYFKTIVNGGGWTHRDFCRASPCALESVWSLTTGEPQAVLAKRTTLGRRDDSSKPTLAVAAISIPMRSLIEPVLPPGFAFAVIDHSGKVLFHSDPQRNGNEEFFVETDNNRRLRAQVAAHSADALNLNYWGAQYRAYVKPMELPGMYVVAMAQKERAWAINREWLIVTLTFVAAYLVLWLFIALMTLVSGAAWVWPDPRRRKSYRTVSIVCVVILACAAVAVGFASPLILVSAGVLLPVAGWCTAAALLRSPRQRADDGDRTTVFTYSVTAVLVLLVSGVLPGALLFLASYRLHAWSYIKNSQSIVSTRLADRHGKLKEAYLLGEEKNLRRVAAWYTGVLADRDIYVDFLYNTFVSRPPNRDGVTEAVGAGHDESPASHEKEHHKDNMLLWLLEDWLPYYSEASVEWRELLHEQSDDDTWTSRRSGEGLLAIEAEFTAHAGRLPLQLTSWVPAITHVPPTLNDKKTSAPAAPTMSSKVQHASVTVGGTTAAEPRHAPVETTGASDSWLLLLLFGGGLVAVACGVVQIFNRRVFLVGITQPLWACGLMARSAGQNVLVLCDSETKAEQLKGMTSLGLGPIVTQSDFKGAWRKALFELDQESDDGSVLIADFDEDLDDACGMDRKLMLLEELVLDESRRVVVLSRISLRGLTDSVRHSAGASSAAPEAREATLDRWKRIVKALVIVERRQPRDRRCEGQEQRSPAVTFLLAERDSHPEVRRVCDDLLQADAAAGNRLTRAQAFDELVERTAQFYRGLWMSCSEDEKVVLGHVARHGLANASVRSVVRQLLGRGLLHADPAFRPMNETFRHFILTRECLKQVEALETANGPSSWDRLRAPLGVAVLGVGIFLFATQKELYNAIFGLVTAAAASVPTLIQTVGKLVGRPVDGPGLKA